MDMFIFGRRLISNNILLTYHIHRSNLSDIKNRSYEFFKSFDKDSATCSMFVNDISLSAYIKKVMKITQKFFIKSIIINTSNSGRIQVLINTEI